MLYFIGFLGIFGESLEFDFLFEDPIEGTENVSSFV